MIVLALMVLLPVLQCVPRRPPFPGGRLFISPQPPAAFAPRRRKTPGSAPAIRPDASRAPADRGVPSCVHGTGTRRASAPGRLTPPGVFHVGNGTARIPGKLLNFQIQVVNLSGEAPCLNDIHRRHDPAFHKGLGINHQGMWFSCLQSLDFQSFASL
jgi:hypothetical protein